MHHLCVGVMQEARARAASGLEVFGGLLSVVGCRLSAGGWRLAAGSRLLL